MRQIFITASKNAKILESAKMSSSSFLAKTPISNVNRVSLLLSNFSLLGGPVYLVWNESIMPTRDLRNGRYNGGGGEDGFDWFPVVPWVHSLSYLFG